MRTPDHITDPVDPVPVVNIANALTVFRILLVPVFIVVLFIDGGHDTVWRIVAALVFAGAAFTDRVDGRLARERGLVTDFGKMADPIADKALIGAALIGLSVLGDLSWWVTGIIGVRELWVTLLRFWVIRYAVIPASRGGKLKTLLQSVAIGLLVLPLGGMWHTAAMVIMWAAVAVTVVTGIDYTWQALRVRVQAARSDSTTGSLRKSPTPPPSPEPRASSKPRSSSGPRNSSEPRNSSKPTVSAEARDDGRVDVDTSSPRHSDTV